MTLSYIFMTLIHYYVDQVKVKIVLKGVLSVNFKVINDKISGISELRTH